MEMSEVIQELKVLDHGIQRKIIEAHFGSDGEESFAEWYTRERNGCVAKIAGAGSNS